MNARTVCLARFSLSEIAKLLLEIVVIKSKKAVKKGRVKITNSAVAEPADDLVKNLVGRIFIYSNCNYFFT